ncbi:hypothetical protein [Inhella proteolytica]|uniref:Uncharacterized protein n=1 Tax=Inhella proteolytica TaxID=2795029 RepID=A0A931J2J5_9BURK|nr:hypothetical protein [Inhella proteolytica]MBH9576985.1 hypothetical protein [Inhella proteolytica]
MPHRLLARSSADDSRHALSMSFAFSETLPSVSWAPPPAELLYDQTLAQERSAALELPALETAWAETERMGL